jgi:hypothetical protein
VRIAAVYVAVVWGALAVARALDGEQHRSLFGDGPIAIVSGVAFITTVMIVMWILIPLGIGRLIALVFRMTCPRCGGAVSWLAWSWRPESGSRRLTVCLQCNAFLRTWKSESGWTEIPRGP